MSSLPKFLAALSSDPHEERVRHLGDWHIGREMAIARNVQSADCATLRSWLQQVGLTPVSSDCTQLRAQVMLALKMS